MDEPEEGAIEYPDAQELDISALVAQAADAAMSGMGHVLDETNDEIDQGIAIEAQYVSSRAEIENGKTPTTGPDIDFSSAPADPTELALWVAKQISNFQTDRETSGEPEGDVEEEERRKRTQHPPAAHNRRFDDDHDPVKAAERERIREENRERKKRWRESNSERNKDNDLRCRINKRAKKLFGIGLSREKSAWMETEFNKRRAKRESKERIKSFDGGLFPGFSFAPGFQNALFPAPGEGPQGQTNAAGLLLANALLGVGNTNDRSNAEAASALKAALEAGTLDPKPFTEALRAMAANPEIMNGINAILGTGSPGYDDDADPGSPDESVNPSNQVHESATSEAIKSSAETESDSTDIIKALNAATAILNEMNDGTHQDGTGGPEYLHTGLNDEMHDAHGLNQNQVEALLALASGGSVNGHLGGSSKHADHSKPRTGHKTPPQHDSEITETLQRIVQQLSEEKNTLSDDQNQSLSTAVNNFAVTATRSDGFRNPTDALQSLLQTSGVSVNTIMPSAQSHATSKFYARLSARSTQHVGGGINPAHAKAYGNTTDFNLKLMSKADRSSQTIPAPTKPQSSKAKDPLIQAKIKKYGFPPPPGSRPGALKRKAQ